VIGYLCVVFVCLFVCLFVCCLFVVCLFLFASFVCEFCLLFCLFFTFFCDSTSLAFGPPFLFVELPCGICGLCGPMSLRTVNSPFSHLITKLLSTNKLHHKRTFTVFIFLNFLQITRERELQPNNTTYFVATFTAEIKPYNTKQNMRNLSVSVFIFLSFLQTTTRENELQPNTTYFVAIFTAEVKPC